jgi:protein-S-isoprenylcysteine O-methyltransferase Ste14/uncharacterized membrane protein (UPF0127 family)
MPIKNLTKNKILPYKVMLAENLFSRLIGLLGKSKLSSKCAIHIVPCKGIHTLGMKFPIDVLFLDSQGMALKWFSNLTPNKISQVIPSSHSVLELPANSISETDIQIGDHIQVIHDEHLQVDLEGLKKIFHWPINIFIALLWSRFILASFLNWKQNGEIFHLGLVFVNTLLFFLFLTRRESTETSTRILDWVIPILTMTSAMILKPLSNNIDSLNGISMGIQVFGILSILSSLTSLGRSFGVIPANRKIKYSGLYKVVRHPLYASELIFYFGFLIGNFSIINLFGVIIILTGQMYRAISEEKLLSKDLNYIKYKKDVKYRFLPGFY